MRASLLALSLCVGMGCMALTAPVQASRSEGRSASSEARSSGNQSRPQAQRASRPTGGGGLSCVPYARMVTGMEVRGNGRDWWHNAAGRYARGSRPEPGSVLAFPGSGSMRMGHVAVVSRVINGRHIEIDHSNWGGPGIRRGTVMRGVSVIDVSSDNSWTEVRVQVGWDRDTHGRVFPTYGFIHNRPDMGDGPVYASYQGGARFSRATWTRPATSARSSHRVNRAMPTPPRPVVARAQAGQQVARAR